MSYVELKTYITTYCTSGTEQLVNQMFSAPLNKLKAQESAQAIQYRGDLQQLGPEL